LPLASNFLNFNLMQMKNKLVKIGLVLAGILTLNACDKDALVELNNNPNAVTAMDPAFLLTTATLRIGGEYENTRANMLYAATMIQHTASTAGYFSGDKYFYNAQYSGAYMERHFTDVIRLYSNIIEQTKDDASKANLNAIATILRAFDMHRITDLHGDIPYTQAGYGLQNPENWFPKYEPQKDVYAAIVRDVKAARDKLSANGGAVGAQDVVYGGDITKWKKFANALLMRAALRMQKVDAATGRTIFAEAYASGTFSSNADNGTIKYLNGPQGHNRNGLSDGYWNTYKYSRDCKVSETFVNWMKANNDPRLMIVCGGTGNPDVASTWVTDPTAQRGLPNGYTSTTLLPTLSAADRATFTTPGIGTRMFSMLNLKYMDWEDPYYLISYAETELMAAEAAVRGWINANAQTHFTNGVRGAIQAWTLFDPSFARSTAEIDAYIAGRNFAAADTENKIRLIGEEFWAATYLNDMESYANWRRLDYPKLTPTKDPNAFEGPVIPRRLIYWENEAGSNPANFAAAVSRMGGDKFATRVWWDGGK
jgi:hypothetical protein